MGHSSQKTVTIDLKVALPRVRAAYEAGDLQAQRRPPGTKWWSCYYKVEDDDGQTCRCAIGAMTEELDECPETIRNLISGDYEESPKVQIVPDSPHVIDLLISLQGNHDLWATGNKRDKESLEEKFLDTLDEICRVVGV